VTWILTLEEALLLSSLTGLILCLIWQLFRRLFDRPETLWIIYQGLRLTVLFWLFPAAFLLLGIWTGSFSGGMIRGMLPVSTPVMNLTAAAVGLIWCTGFLITAFRYLRDAGELRHLLAGCRQAEITAEELTEAFRGNRRLSGRVRVYECGFLPGALTAGVLHPVILLPPAGAYTREERRLMLLHEAVHVMSHDVF